MVDGGQLRTMKNPSTTSSCRRHASDWNTCRMVLSPTIMMRCPFVHCEKWDALNACSSQACGSKVLRNSCTGNARRVRVILKGMPVPTAREYYFIRSAIAAACARLSADADAAAVFRYSGQVLIRDWLR